MAQESNIQSNKTQKVLTTQKQGIFGKRKGHSVKISAKSFSNNCNTPLLSGGQSNLDLTATTPNSNFKSITLASDRTPRQQQPQQPTNHDLAVKAGTTMEQRASSIKQNQKDCFYLGDNPTVMSRLTRRTLNSTRDSSPFISRPFSVGKGYDVNNYLTMKDEF